jgi:ABC-2 type transport system ATP-binding protein
MKNQTNTDAETAISVKNVSKTFKLPHERNTSIKSLLLNFYRRPTFERQKALEDISIEIKKGDFFGIVGRNGSGKSTLLKLLAEIYVPTKGTVQINGKLTPFIELGVGFNPELTGRENVFLNGALLGFNYKEMLAMYQDIVEFAEIERFMDQKLKNYSSGMQVRLAFSIAIRAQSDILLLDEVLAVGDAAFQQKCYDYFEELKQRKQTVVFVSHDMGAVRRFCNKAVYIEDGKLTHSGTPSDIADVYTVTNIEGQSKSSSKAAKTQGPHKVSTKIIRQTQKEVTVEVAYKSTEDDEMYVAIGVTRDGISFAEITTSMDKPLLKSGKVIYTLDTTVLNGGSYQIAAVLCRMRNRELLSAAPKKCSFAIKGDDITKGAALKLADTWEYQ